MPSEEVEAVVAFVVSILLGIVVLAVPFTIARKRRPVGTPLTWGQAMVASVWVFFLMFWWYGVVPHQFLAWADNELGWRADTVWYGPNRILDKLPFDLSFLVARDLLVVNIYILALVANVALWAAWQNRGKSKPTTDIARSEYGRPLVKA